MASPVTHFEISTENGPELAKFYGELLGWHVESFDIPGGGGMTYEMVDTHAGSGINGGIGTKMPGGGTYVTVYAEADDIQATLDKAVKLGATVALPVSPIGDMVTIAIFIDPFGNTFGLTQANPQAAQMGGVSSGSNPAIDWFEVLGPDGKAVRKFYGDLFGWEISESMGDGFDYGEVKAEGRGIGGGLGQSPTGGPMTTIYARVDDLEKYLERAETLGAKKIMGPMNAGETVSIAQFADPQGNVFGLYKSNS